jgi:gluconokinase
LRFSDQNGIALSKLAARLEMELATGSVVVMGVAGCGKSSLGQAVARRQGWPLIEGDDHHSATSKDKMARGIALTDADRAGWLQRLGQALQAHPQGAVLTCSALKKSYRDTLRSASPGLRFIFLDIDRADALARVKAREGQHFFSASLVDDQFATLESPVGEPGVLPLSAREPLAQLSDAATRWLESQA